MEIENFIIKGINNVNIVKSGDLYYCLNPENMEVEKLNGTYSGRNVVSSQQRI